jgi:DNA-binding NarL/FixJ family response regulator
MADLTVLLAIPRAILRASLGLALAADGHHLYEATDLDAACEVMARVQPTVAFVALASASGQRGFTFDQCRRIIAAGHGTGVVLLTDNVTTSLARDALESGARGVFETGHGIDLLRRAARVVADGEVWLSRTMTGSLLISRSIGQTSDRPERPPLTTRERQVVLLLAEGKGHRAIADELLVSPHTARTHIRNVMRKLGAHSRLEAIAMARDDGLLASAER